MKFVTDIQARINSLRAEEDGASAVEYGLLVSLIAVVIVAGVTLIGTTLNGTFTGVAGSL
ncbi:Flp family type IVb pilin [Naasia sp. SYSU D00948]|uniref:Flp family type IVb pilin n=1 Tax=Naasia sp. SYSU D00948 TaxID=2817379 RepID=UPI001B303A50|nr:Flp family type IVb pilin [Naasia sp. SYSU D00948]